MFMLYFSLTGPFYTWLCLSNLRYPPGKTLTCCSSHLLKDDTPAPTTKITISTAIQNQAPPTYNTENEIMLQDDKPSTPAPGSSPSPQALSTTKHTNVEHMGYSKLYKEIAATNKNQKQASATTSNPMSTQKQEKIGRNDKCLCGSGKKYKNCHGKI